MGRGRDEFWDHAEKLNGGKRFRCNYCEIEFAGGATRIKYHLSQHKGGDIQICSRVPDHVRLAAVRAINPNDQGCFSNSKKLLIPKKENKKKKKKKSIASSSSRTEMVHKSKATTNFGCPDDDEIAVNTKLAEFMILHNIPFEVAETPLLDEFVKCVSDFGSYYQQRPCSTTLRRQLEYDIPKQVVEYTKHAEESLLQTGCALIYSRKYELLYAWTSKGLVFKGTCPFHDYTCNKLASMIQSLGPNHILQLVIDDDDNDDANNEYYEVIAREVFTAYPWMCITRCATRQILSYFCNISDDQYKLTTCASLVFLYMEKNHSNLLPLREGHSNAQSSSIVGLAYDLIKGHDKISDFVVGFLRLKSLMEIEDRFQASQLPVQTDSRSFHLLVNHKEFWIWGKQVVLALQPLLEAFCLLISNNNVTVGYLYQFMERAKNLIQGLCCFVFSDITRTNFNQMYKRMIHPIHAVAAFLNPAYLCSANFRKENKDMKQGIDFVLEYIVQFEERDDFMAELLSYRSKDPKLFTLSALTMLNTSHPGEWWEYCGDCVPVLQKYALKIVTQPCSFFSTNDDELESIKADKSNDQLKTKIIMMKKSVTPKALPAEATNLVDQLAALLDRELYCFENDCYFQRVHSLDNAEDFWDFVDDLSLLDFLDDLSLSFLHNFDTFSQYP